MSTLMRAVRDREAYTQTVTAFHSHTHQAEISLFERRVKVPRPRQAVELSRVLGIPPHALQYEVVEIDEEKVEQQ
jgi:hypothetical protein